MAFPEARPIDLRRLATVDRWWRLVAIWSLAVAVAWSVAFFSARNPTQFNPKASMPRTAVEALSAWDGEPYTKIAAGGYSTSGEGARLFNWFPLFPLVSRLLGGEAAALAGILLSQLLALASLMLMSVMAHGERSAPLPLEPGFWLLISPFGFFLMAFYTESLFLLLSLIHYFAYRTQAVGRAGVAGFLAGLTRPTAVLLPAMLGVEAALRLRRNDRWRRVAIAALSPAAGIGLYFAYVGWQTGDPLGYLHTSSRWFPRTYSFPLHPVAVELRQWITGLASGTVPLFDMVARNLSTCAMLLLLFLGRRRLPASWLAYSGASLVLMHSYLPAGGSGRYELVLFPVFFALATTRLAKSRAWIPLALTFGVFWVVCLYRFTTWRWIS